MTNVQEMINKLTDPIPLNNKMKKLYQLLIGNYFDFFMH